MKDAIPPGLSKELARDFGFDEDAVRDALMEAVQVYRDECAFVAFRSRGNQAIAALAPALRAARRANQAWAKVPPEARREVSLFVGGPGDVDHVGSRLEFVTDLLEEYAEHYANVRGNPGKSRTGAMLPLSPLKEFIAVLRAFWEAHAAEPFGHVIERDDEVEGVDSLRGEKAPRTPKSHGIDFAMHAAVCLHPDRYDIGAFETAIQSGKAEGKSV